jgi:hypothetical protein
MAYSLLSGAALAIVVTLIVNGLRRRGWSRFRCLAAAAVVLVLTFWFDLVRVLDSDQLQSQEQSAVASQQAQAGRALQNLQSAVPGPGTVRWHGRVTISPSTGLELDPVPPKPGNGTDSDINIGPSGQDQISGSATSPLVNTAPWAGPAFPDQGQCSLQLESSPQAAITVRPGDIVCVRTAAGRIAALKFISVTRAHGSDVAEATVWQ